MRFIIATHNGHKLKELKRILEPLGIDAVTDRDLGITLSEAEETGSTFAENAEIKATSGCRESGLPCIADDSGLAVDALGGEPGVYSARYAGEHGDDEANIVKLLTKLADIPEEKRTARFVCSICVVFPDGRKLTVEGKSEGRIGYEKRGEGGFGYDPVFMFGDRSFSELSAEEKDEVSHRGHALRALARELPKYIND